MEVIAIGFDREQVKPDPDARASTRQELGIPADAPLIGLAARFHPLKDHFNFVSAAARLHRQMPKVHFLLCGINMTWENSRLAGWIEAEGLLDCCHLLGQRHDMSRLFSGSDIATSASRREAFPIAMDEPTTCGP